MFYKLRNDTYFTFVFIDNSNKLKIEIFICITEISTKFLKLVLNILEHFNAVNVFKLSYITKLIYV